MLCPVPGRPAWQAVVALFASALLLGAEPPADAVKKDTAALEGEWAMVSAERDGQAVPEEFVKTGKRVFKDGVTTVTVGDMVLMKAKVSLAPGKTPKAIDYEVTEGQAKGKKVLGIYEIDGDTAKFCFAGPDQDRPADFTAKERSGRTLSVWKKAKK
jgi:uncharacterized protein (TIGR03067 family)